MSSQRVSQRQHVYRSEVLFVRGYISNVPCITKLYRRFSISLDNKRLYLITRFKSVGRRWIRKCAQTTKLTQLDLFFYSMTSPSLKSSCNILNIKLLNFLPRKNDTRATNRLRKCLKSLHSINSHLNYVNY
ncbi:unnamed protein product [Lasius platythorax]|uniref:Uncharacterized protein n=1 Tax=Lasius platythorax TaxID=488582 RepID=A0AAV2NEF8_9HYME